MIDLFCHWLPREFGEAVLKLAKRPPERFRRFYADTASLGSSAAIECGLAFFGTDHVLFGSDMPFDPEGGPSCIRQTLRAIRQVRISDAGRKAILVGSAKRLLGLP